MEALLTVIMPAFNEERQIGESLARVLECGQGHWQIVVCDDASSDRTAQIASQVGDGRICLVVRATNGGKTSAVLEGLEHATADWVAIQDADLEYNPADLLRLLEIARSEKCAVYGRRQVFGIGHLAGC